MTPIEKDKLVTLCAKWNLTELNMSKGVFMDEKGITMNLRGDVPIVGVTIAGTLHTEGHGVSRVADIQKEIDYIITSSPSNVGLTPHKKDPKTSQSSSTEQLQSAEVKHTSESMEATHPKLGTPDTLKEVKGTTVAVCSGCSEEIIGTIDMFQKIQEKYGQIYCLPCREKTETKKEETKPDQKTIRNVHGAPEQMKPVIKTCHVCSFALTPQRALECFQQDTQKPEFICEDCEEKKITPQKEDIMEENLPTKQETVPTKIPVKKTDAQIDEMIEMAKAERFLKGQGGSYSVSGKTRPDSAMVQKFANAADISCEILAAEQTKEYAHVVVRGHRGKKYIDAVVHHDFETEFQLQTMEIIKKNPGILDHYEGLLPVIKEGAKIEQGNKVVDAKYHLIHTLLSFKTFSLRDATTKAMNIVQMKLLNQDAREAEEIASEQKERDLVEDKRNSRR